MNRLLVLDATTTWIRDLFTAVSGNWTVSFLGPQTVGLAPFAWMSREGETVPVPGWNRAYGMSTALMARRVRKDAKANGWPRAVVHTIPWTAGLISRFSDLPHVYRPHDYFGMYSWNQRRVEKLERRMMQQCRLVTPISEAHAAELRGMGKAPVHVLPNGVSDAFVRRLRGSGSRRPDDLPSRGPLVGCIGQINSGYDFDICNALADSVPEATFVFIGPVFDEGPEFKQTTDALFGRTNVDWLGPKPHQELPEYLKCFDACLNPLRVTPANDRRSPLRLYDYLASEKPVLSTGIAAAALHQPHVAVGRSVPEMAGMLRRMFTTPIDLPARRAYVDQQTWSARAQDLAAHVDRYCG